MNICQLQLDCCEEPEDEDALEAVYVWSSTAGQGQAEVWACRACAKDIGRQ